MDRKVENKKTSSSSAGSKMIKNTSVFIACFVIGIILITGLSGVVSACETYVYVNPGESIQDAIDSICPEGGTVELAPGVHDVYEAIVINKSNITIQGTHDSVIRCHNNLKDIFSIPFECTEKATEAVGCNKKAKDYPSYKNFLFKGFKIESSYGDSSSNMGSAIEAWKVENLTVENILDESYIEEFVSINPIAGWADVRSRNIFIKNNTVYILN